MTKRQAKIAFWVSSVLAVTALFAIDWAPAQTLCTPYGDGLACFQDTDRDPVIVQPYGDEKVIEQAPIGNPELYRVPDYRDSGRFDPVPLPDPGNYLEPLGSDPGGDYSSGMPPLPPSDYSGGASRW